MERERERGWRMEGETPLPWRSSVPPRLVSCARSAHCGRARRRGTLRSRPPRSSVPRRCRFCCRRPCRTFPEGRRLLHGNHGGRARARRGRRGCGCARSRRRPRRGRVCLTGLSGLRILRGEKEPGKFNYGFLHLDQSTDKLTFSLMQ